LSQSAAATGLAADFVSGQKQFVERREVPLSSSTGQPNANTTADAANLREYLALVRATPLVIALTVFAIFLPAVIVPYAYSDDYAILWMAISGDPTPGIGKTILDTTSSGGRPLMGLLLQAAFRTAGTIDNLRFVRFVGILGIVALALLLQWALVRSRIKPVIAALIAVLVCSMPAFQVAASWAVVFTAPYAALLAAGASVVATSIVVDSPRDLLADKLLGAVAMLLAGLLIYQPAAMFFWVFLAIALVGAARDTNRAMRVLRAHAGVAFVALLLALVIGKLAAHAVGNTSPNAARSAFTHDVVGKAHWFFSHPLYRSLSLFELTPSRWVTALVVVLAVGGIVPWLLRHGSRPLLYVVTGATLIPLSFLPNLVVEDSNSFVFRTGIALTSLLALYACLGLLGMLLLLRDWLQPRLSVHALVVAERSALAVSAALVAAIAFVASSNVTTLVVEPQNTELRIIRSHVAALPTGVSRVGFVQIGWDQGITSWYSDELGLASSARPWSPGAAVPLILREEGRLSLSGPRPTVDTFPWYAQSFPNGEPVIDLRQELQKLRSR
jgi:hypothetical protein